MAIDLRPNQGAALGLRPGAEAELTTIRLPSGARFTVASKVAPQFQAFLTELEQGGYKLNPEKSGGYNDRNIAGSARKSQHAFGNAIDLNWDVNAQGQSKHDLPENIRDIAAKHGIVWGGTFSNPDPMHFEVASLTGGGQSHEGHSHGNSAEQPSGAAKDKEMFDIMAALGGKNLLDGMGKGLGNDSMVKAGDQNSIFGSLTAMFGGGQGGGTGGGGQSANPMGDANMKLAQGAQAAAGEGEEQIPTYQRKPVDLSNLMKIIQQRSQLGAAPRQPGSPGVMGA